MRAYAKRICIYIYVYELERILLIIVTHISRAQNALWEDRFMPVEKLQSQSSFSSSLRAV